MVGEGMYHGVCRSASRCQSLLRSFHLARLHEPGSGECHVRHADAAAVLDENGGGLAGECDLVEADTRMDHHLAALDLNAKTLPQGAKLIVKLVDVVAGVG